MDRCDECGFTYVEDEAPAAGDTIVGSGGELSALLRSGRPEIVRRAEPSTWSPLEYGCHVRDVLLTQRERVLAARRAVEPSWPPMGRDERAEHDGYAEQSPDDVARQLDDAAAMFANVLQRVADSSEWDRTLIYNYPTRQARPLRWVAVHTVHEVSHHLGDVRRQVPGS